MKRLNVQGLARRVPELMTTIGQYSDRENVSIDLSSGEPTVSAHYSRDPNYLYACFDGVGKAPFFKDGILMISDIYLMTMSKSPIGANTIREAFDKKWNGKSFADQWLEDDEVIKKALKASRQLHKMLALGLGYGMGPKKMVNQCYDNGYSLDISTAKLFYKAYWSLFSGLRQFANKCQLQVQAKGYIVNAFGYRATPPPHKAFNYLIQSSVSGIMHVFLAKLLAAAPYAEFVVCIHDELIMTIPKGMRDEFFKAKELATQSLNDDLKWSVPIRTGFVVGSNWYEAK